ncbi:MULTISPECIES: intradiol ring-cleavage dioxygenase [unclassified Massilia]|uniref:dioxygenase family protein n=1 Tax=unclassified Massilia TaxID=2609279 RepID=UPI001B82DD87|nr:MULTISPECIES: intradiol ring-cleavage dioxygenase [unclassified Massilia]MBQ5938443.1 intradiol ring-cleavage dioxygenase [Massilia sp. AB1]MBQ5963249.1 intradiol ring-cleavage dioxygenase [Massilia sp. ZL223]
MHDHDRGLAVDLENMLAQPASRRRSLRWLLAGAASLPLAGYGGRGAGGDYGITTSTTTSGAATDTGTVACTVIPEETAGPYPDDGSKRNVNGVDNALALAGIVRSDIRASVGGATGVAEGIPLTIRLKMVNVAAGCTPAAGVAVYLWHCTREGGYSMYSSGIAGENYLRGVQEADSQGGVSFTTIFPGCYDGRKPHGHGEVYPSLAKAGSAANKIKTSQFTFPMAVLNEAYASSGYSASVRNLAQLSYANDMVFAAGTALRMASVTGNAAQGYVATLAVGVSL